MPGKATGGSAPPSPVIAAMEAMGFRVTHLYGLTEVYGPATLCAWQEDWSALPLEQLSEESSRELAVELLGRVDASDRAVQVAATAEGNPLFIEELARCIGDQPTHRLDELPTSIRAIIAARLDALPPALGVRVLDRARTPRGPVRPNVPLNIGAGRHSWCTARTMRSRRLGVHI